MLAEVHRAAIHLLYSPEVCTHAAHFSQQELKTSSCVLLLGLRREQQQGSALNVFHIGQLSSAWSVLGVD